MKAIQVYEFGGPEVLELQELPTPKPKACEVLVRVHAAGVNPYDTYMRAGTYAIKPPLPYTPGSDAAGVVDVRDGLLDALLELQAEGRTAAADRTGGTKANRTARRSRGCRLRERRQGRRKKRGAQNCGCDNRRPIGPRHR